jgi:RimJ/RimL family protein N-acetyltransferase
VDWETHCRWLEKKLEAPGTRLYVVYSKGQPCAQFRVEPTGETSIAIAEAFRGQGLSSRIIQEGCSLYAAEFQLDRPFTAQIKPENQASRRSFERAGFRIFNDSNTNELDYITLTFDARSTRRLN